MSRSSGAWATAPVLALLAATAGCGEQQAEPNAAAPAPAVAAGAAPSASAPGEIEIRKPSRFEAKLVPPNSVIGADPDLASPALAFQNDQDPAPLLDWFRATGNGADFVLESEMQEGDEHVFSGRVRASGEGYTVRVAPRPNGGTTGVVVVTAR
jgi:hypothetical protein